MEISGYCWIEYNTHFLSYNTNMGKWGLDKLEITTFYLLSFIFHIAYLWQHLQWSNQGSK